MVMDFHSHSLPSFYFIALKRTLGLKKKFLATASNNTCFLTMLFMVVIIIMIYASSTLYITKQIYVFWPIFPPKDCVYHFPVEVIESQDR